MLSFLIAHTPILSLIIGPVVTYLGDYIHKMWSWLDNQSSLVKQAFAVVLSFVLVGLTQFIPGVVPTECTDIAAMGITAACENALSSGPFLQAIVAAVVAVAVKHGQQNAAKTSTPALTPAITTPVTPVAPPAA